MSVLLTFGEPHRQTSDLQTIVLTSTLTVLGAIAVFVVGQVIAKFLLEPLDKLKAQIGGISDVLVFHANIYTNPGLSRKEDMDETSKVLHQRASLLRARAHASPGYRFFSLLRLVPQPKDVREASRNLIGLSNAVRVEGRGLENYELANKARRLLKLPSD